MRVNCPQCQRAFQLPDERLPPGKEVSVICPGCKGRFGVTAPSTVAPGGAAEAEPVEAGTGSRGEPPGCLLCVSDRALAARLKAMLERTGLLTAQPRSPMEAIDLLRSSNIPLLIYEEGFDAGSDAGLWPWLTRLSGEARRRIFAVFLGRGIASGDPMMALSRSADLALEIGEAERLPRLFAAAREERDRLYQPLHSVLREMGLETSG